MYKEKRKANKMLKISIIIIIFLLFSFFSYYFINQYKSVILYSISGRSTNFKLEGGLFFHTNDKLYFNSGNLINYKNYTIHKIELIYIKNNKEKVLYTLNYNNNGFNNIILDD